MLRHKREQLKVAQNQDGPPEPTPLDIEIARNNGTTVALEATQKRLQASKRNPPPSLLQMVEQRTRENGQLRQQIAYLQRKNSAAVYLQEEIKYVDNLLGQALINFHDLNREYSREEDEQSVYSQSPSQAR